MSPSADHREGLFAETVERDLGAIRRLARSYERDPGLAEDLVQEILFAFWQALERFEGRASARTYLFRIAQNCALRHIARQRARQDVDHSDDQPLAKAVAGEHSPEGSTLQAERRRQLQKAVSDLSEPLRQVVVLRLEGLSAKEIGAVLGLTANNVTVRLHRARTELRRRLADPASGNQPTLSNDAMRGANNHA